MGIWEFIALFSLFWLKIHRDRLFVVCFFLKLKFQTESGGKNSFTALWRHLKLKAVG